MKITDSELAKLLDIAEDNTGAAIDKALSSPVVDDNEVRGLYRDMDFVRELRERLER